MIPWQAQAKMDVLRIVMPALSIAETVVKNDDMSQRTGFLVYLMISRISVLAHRAVMTIDHPEGELSRECIFR